jgi:hypothetical protein
VTTTVTQAASATDDLVVLPALGPSGAYRPRNCEIITDTAGVPVAELSIVPPLYVSRTISAQRTAHPLPIAQREAALAKAAGIFTESVIAGLDFNTYVERASRVAGLPIGVARNQIREVFAVHASGNAPGVHALWLQALPLGYRVAIRPSRREPFTAHRLIYALREAGFRPQDVVYLPTDYAGADEIIRAADLSMVYGGQDVVDKYATDPTVFPNGPGRTKILITAEKDWRDYLDVIVDSIGNLGGMACVNTTAVLYEGDPAPLAQAIAERLSTIKPLPISDERAILPTQPIASARSLAAYLAAKAAGSTPILGADQVVADLGDGYAALRPAVHLLATPDVEKLNVELAFPCVWVAPWSRSDGLHPLRHSLVLNAITTDDVLLDDLINEPTVTNLYSGNHPTYHMTPEIPHDGFLADFLMRNKGFIRDWGSRHYRGCGEMICTIPMGPPT